MGWRSQGSWARRKDGGRDGGASRQYKGWLGVKSVRLPASSSTGVSQREERAASNSSTLNTVNNIHISSTVKSISSTVNSIYI